MDETTFTIQSVENFWDNRPCNLKHSSKELGSEEYFNEVEQRKYFVEPHIKDFANFSLLKNKKVLEIGCGIGTDATNFARAGAIYTGIELSLESLKIAKKRFEVFNLDGRLIHGNVEKLSEIIPIEEFDLIYSFGVLHHTPSLEKALSEISKFCTQNTIFKFMVYSSNSFKKAMIDAGLDQFEAQSGCPIANTYTVQEIVNILRKFNFKVKRIYKDHIFQYDVEKYKNYQYEKLPYFKTMPEDLIRTLEKRFGWHTMVECNLSLE
jgi:ubiquinone/menaquinone biosynthesis C-methylase UbiE